MEKLLTYGLSSGKLKHISDVGNGLSCNCICPNCEVELVAKNNPNNVKLPHFAHKGGNECSFAFETALHLLAKSILFETKELHIPNFHFDYNPTNKKSLFKKGRKLKFEQVILEKQIIHSQDIITPDAIGVINGKRLFIEFANTHFVEDEI